MESLSTCTLWNSRSTRRRQSLLGIGEKLEGHDIGRLLVLADLAQFVVHLALHVGPATRLFPSTALAHRITGSQVSKDLLDKI